VVMLGGAMGRRRVLRGKLSVRRRHAREILAGRKRATVRVGYVEPEGDTVVLYCGGEPLARLRILEVRHKRLGELSDEDARLEGLSSADELRRELRRIYGDLGPETPVSVIVFEVAERFGREARPGPVKIAKLALSSGVELSEEERRVLQAVLTTGSVKGAAAALYGACGRRIVKRVLRDVERRLRERGLLGEGSG